LSTIYGEYLNHGSGVQLSVAMVPEMRD